VIRVHGQLHQVRLLSDGEGTDLVVAVQHVGRAQGLGLEGVVDADDLVGAVNLSRGCCPGDGGLDVEQWDRRADRPVVVERDVGPRLHRVAPAHPLRAQVWREHRPVEEVAPVDELERSERDRDPHVDRTL